MNKVEKPKARKDEELRRALVNLRSANELWEQRRYEQSEFIASILRLMLYDPKKKNGSVSIFQQHGMKKVDFYANPLFVHIEQKSKVERVLASPITEALVLQDGTQSGRVAWMPVYNLPPDALDNPFTNNYQTQWDVLPFKDWWNEPVLHSEDHSYTRAGLILCLANRLGGAHSDASIFQHDLDLLNKRFGYSFRDISLQVKDKRYTPENTIYEAVVRQIAYEVERTIAHHFPKMLGIFDVVPRIPDAWGGQLGGIGVRIERTHEQERELYSELVNADGENSGLVDSLRSEIYWNNYRSKLRKLGL